MATIKEDTIVMSSLEEEFFAGNKAVFVNHEVDQKYLQFCQNQCVHYGGKIHLEPSAKTTHVFSANLDSILTLFAILCVQRDCCSPKACCT